MKIDVSQTIKDYEGKDAIESESKKPIILQDLISFSINNYTNGEMPTAETKNKAFQLSMKIFSSNNIIDLTLDDRSFIKERMNIIYNNPLFCGRVAEILEDKEKEDK